MHVCTLSLQAVFGPHTDTQPSAAAAEFRHFDTVGWTRGWVSGLQTAAPEIPTEKVQFKTQKW